MAERRRDESLFQEAAEGRLEALPESDTRELRMEPDVIRLITLASKEPMGTIIALDLPLE
jgi:hypothetical protein